MIIFQKFRRFPSPVSDATQNTDKNRTRETQQVETERGESQMFQAIFT